MEKLYKGCGVVVETDPKYAGVQMDPKYAGGVPGKLAVRQLGRRGFFHLNYTIKSKFICDCYRCVTDPNYAGGVPGKLAVRQLGRHGFFHLN